MTAPTQEKQIKNAFLYMLPQVASALVPFVTLPIFTRILTREDYGLLALGYVYGAVVTGLANFGLTTIYRRDFFEHRHDRRKAAELLFSTLSFVILMFLAITAITYVFRGELCEFFLRTPGRTDILFCAMLAPFLLGLNEYYFIYFANKAKAEAFAGFNVAEIVLTVVLSLTLVAGLRVGVIGLLLAPIGSGLLVFVALTVRFLRRLPPGVNARVLGRSLRLACPLMPRIVMGVVNGQADKLLIGTLLSVASAGVYGIGQRIAGLVVAFMTALQRVHQPRVYELMFSDEPSARRAIGQYLWPFVYVCVGVAFLLAVFAEEGLWVLTPPSYHGAIEVVMVLAMYEGLLFFGMVPQLAFMKKTGLISIIGITGMVLNLAMYVPFIRWWGAVGAAWATLGAGAVGTGIYFAVSQRYYRVEWPYGRLAASVALLLGGGLSVLLLRDLAMAYLPRLAVKLVLVAALVYLGTRTGILNRRTLQALLTAARRTPARAPAVPGQQE